MIPEKSAVLLFLINVLFAGALGVGAGGLTCLILRQPWGMKAALVDAALAAVVAVIAAYIISAIEASRGFLDDGTALIFAIAAASIVVRHLIRLAELSAYRTK